MQESPEDTQSRRFPPSFLGLSFFNLNKETTNMSTKELKSAVAELSEKILADITVSDTGAAVIADGVYDKNLPTGLTPDIIKAVSDHNTNFVAAGTHAFGTAAINAMAKSDAFDKVEGVMPLGYKDTYGLTTTRKVVTGPEDNQKTEFGVTVGVLNVRAGANGNQVKIAHSLLSELAAEKFGQ
jgi:hypothetical protein